MVGQERTESQAMHVPVLPSAVSTHADVKPGEVWVDCTVGFGGHSAGLLEKGARLFAIDQDQEALDYTANRFAKMESQVTFLKGNFRHLGRLLDGVGVERVDGILADIGVSSYQLDQSRRGFSFRQAGPVDMRMDVEQGETAESLIGRLSISELAHIIRNYGEEPFAGPIARSMKLWFEESEERTTLALAEAVASAIPRKVAAKRRHHPATRSFQGLRIAVNDELGALESLLDAVPDRLQIGGRILIISFHSLEDRLVKKRMNAWSGKNRDVGPRRGLPAPVRFEPEFELLTRKAAKADAQEEQSNPRSRSARLRAARKLREVA